jgi:hypothetical protein
MAHREFRDENGGIWQVWDVFPSTLEGPLTAERQDRLPDGSDGSMRRATHFRLPAQLRAGWLAFQCQDGECRRLAPIPTNWMNLSDTALAALVRSATHTRTPTRGTDAVGARRSKA